jgi:hypothetical protein
MPRIRELAPAEGLVTKALLAASGEPEKEKNLLKLGMGFLFLVPLAHLLGGGSRDGAPMTGVDPYARLHPASKPERALSNQ